jgi:hypothetical protein
MKPEHIDIFPYCGMHLRILSQRTKGSCIHNHSWSAIYSSSSLYGWRLPKCCFSGPRSSPQGGWSRRCQWNECNNSCVQCGLCKIALSRRRITHCNRCPHLSLQIASRSCHSTSQQAFTMVCGPGHEFSRNDSCIPEYSCHNFSSRLTHFEFFTLGRNWEFLLHANSFYFNEMAHPYCIICHYGF